MKNFLKIADGVDITPLLHSIHSQSDLWDENNLRTTHPLSPHKQCSDIWVLFNRIPKTPEDIVDDTMVIPYRAWDRLAALRPIIFDLMRRVEGVQIGRVLITKLEPGKTIPPHVDQGTPVSFYTRYQIVLQSYPGCIFRIGDERVNFRAGEVWKIDNSVEHEVINNSIDSRIVCIADIRTSSQC